MLVECRFYALLKKMLFLLLSFSFAQAAFAEDLCAPVMDGAILFVAPECLNDSSALVVDGSTADQFGWQYSYDSNFDGVSGGTTGGGVYEMHGIAFRETQQEIWIVLNSNLPLTGDPASGAQNGSVSWGDIFINMTHDTFLPASDAKALYGIRFAETNDSAATTLGVFKEVGAKSVTAANRGFASWGAYASHVSSKGQVATLGDFGQDQKYYDAAISQNVIDQGTLLGSIQFVTPEELTQAGFNFQTFDGANTIGVRFSKRLIIDECGIIGGDGSSCLDCAGVACGRAIADECGVCNGNNVGKDDCGVCFGNNAGKDECGVCFGNNAAMDDCGVCFGDNLAKDDCGVCFGGNEEKDDCGVCFGENKAKDDCGVCFGDNQAKDGCGVCFGNDQAKGCDGVCFSNAIVDDCGICSGFNINKGCDGICFSGAADDDCGVCSGGNKAKGCDGVCFSGQVVDECGVCGGDGACLDTSACVENAPSSESVKIAKGVKKAAEVLKKRVNRFARASTECGGDKLKSAKRKAEKQIEKLEQILDGEVTSSTVVCEDSVCMEVSAAPMLRRLRRIARRLFKLAKNAKLSALAECKYNHEEPDGKVKITEDYRDDLLDSIKGLPKQKVLCTG